MTTPSPAATEGEVRLTEGERLLEVIHSEAHASERCNKECELWHRLSTLPRWPIEAWIAERVRVVEGERDALMQAAWRAYVWTGADTDGDEKWHCTPERAGKTLVYAVESLRKDYDDSLDEGDARAESAEAALAELVAKVEALAAKWDGIAQVDAGLRNGSLHKGHAAAVRALLGGEGA